MKVSELGEFGLIEILRQIASEPGIAGPDLIIGIGDDAAAWRCEASLQIGTTDMLVQDVHFTLDTTSWNDLGWKALAVNISDIAAMGGTPLHALISLGLPADTEVEQVSELYRGMVEIARRFNMSIIGGDTTESPVLVISPSVIGSVKKNWILTRSGANPGDLIAVTGSLGGAAAGFKILQQKLQFDSEVDSVLREAHLRPHPRITEGQILGRNGVKAAIDLSDGLLADLTHICQSSQVSAIVFAESIPLHPAIKDYFPEDATSLALTGGEDYELLFTAPKQTIEKVKQQFSIPLTVIGEVTAGKPGTVTVLDKDGKEINPPKKGWEHFGHRS